MAAADAQSTANVSDAELVRRVKAGQTEAYAPLVERYQERAVHLAFSLVHHWEDARDLSQEAFVKAFRQVASFREEAKFSTWFYRIVVNTCRDFQRRARWRQWRSLDTPSADDEETSLFDALPSDGASPDAQAADRELGDALTRAIERLPTRQRMAFTLRHLEGLSIEEAAEVLQCAPGTVKAHLFHATAKLQKRLQPFAGGAS